MSLRLALAAAVMLAAAPALACTQPANATAVKAQVVSLVNAQRAKAGLPAMDSQSNLNRAAQTHACDMAATLNMSHTGSDGSDMSQRISRAGYRWRAANENIGKGFADAARAVQWWMNSPGHRRNILSSNREIGVGVAVGSDKRLYWVMVSATK